MFLTSAVLPAALVAIAMVLLSPLPDSWKVRTQALVIAMGFYLGFSLIVGPPKFSLAGGVAGLPWVALLLTIFVWLSPASRGSRYLFRALYVGLLFFVLLWSVKQNIQTSQAGLRNLIAFMCLGLGLWSIAEKAAESVQKLTLYALPMISLTASSLLFVFEGSASLGQVTTTMAVIVGGLLALSFVFPKRVSNTAALPFLSVFPVCFLVVGHFFVDINPWRLIMMCWPFLILWFRKVFLFVPKRPIAELIWLSIFAFLPTAYWLYEIYKTSGPLY